MLCLQWQSPATTTERTVPLPKVGYLLTRDSAKISKARKYGVLNVVLYLSPANECGVPGVNLCPFATAGCRKHCLRTSGRMRMGEAPKARLARTLLFLFSFEEFKSRLFREIEAVRRYAKAKGLVPVVRLNGTSDIAWESKLPEVFERFPDVLFYDYTKSVVRMNRYMAGALPKNYLLCFSRSEKNEIDCLDVLAKGGTVAVVFPKAQGLPVTWYGYPVLDGDAHDVRPYDPAGHVVGLTAKGSLRKDTRSPFLSKIRA